MIYDLKTTFADATALDSSTTTGKIIGSAYDLSTLQTSVTAGAATVSAPLGAANTNNVNPQWPYGGTNFAVGATINAAQAGVQARDVGSGEAFYLVLRARTAITLAATSTLQFQIVTAGNPDLITTVNSVAPAVLLSTTTYTNTSFSGGATAPVGYVFFAVAVPLIQCQRFLGVRQVIGTAALTTPGTVDAFLTNDVARWYSYAQPFVN